MKFSKNYIVYFSILLSLLFASKLGLLFYESYFDTHFKYLSQGYFLNGQPDAMINTFGCYIFIGDFFKIVSIKCGVSLNEIFILFSISLLFFNAYILLKDSKIKIPLYFKIGIYTLIFTIVFQVESTRIAILLSGISTLLLLYENHSSVLHRLYLLACIILGLCIRIEGGALAILFISVIYFILNYKTKIEYLKLTMVILPVILLYARVNTPFNLQESEYLQLRPYQFSLWDFNKNQNLDFSSSKDSAIFHTAQKFFLSDKNQMSPEYFKKIGVLKNDKSPTDFFKTLSEKKIDSSHLHINFYKKLLYAFFAISFLFIILYSKQKGPVLFIQVSGIITLLIVWVLMKMELRVLEPILLIILLFSIYIGQLHLDKKITWIFSIILCIVSILNSFQYYLYQKNMADSMGNAIEYIQNIPKNSKIIVNLIPLTNWNNTVLKKNPVLTNKHLLSIDNGLFFLQKNYEKYLLELYSSSEYDIIFKKIADDSSTYFVSNSYRMQMLSNYAHSVYGIDWNYSKIKKFKIAENEIYIYQFNKE